MTADKRVKQWSDFLEALEFIFQEMTTRNLFLASWMTADKRVKQWSDFLEALEYH